jgi:hypothetical protein
MRAAENLRSKLRRRTELQLHEQYLPFPYIPESPPAP